MDPATRPALPRTLLLLAAVLVCALGSLWLRPVAGGVAPWWPASGFAVAAVALSPRRWRPWVGVAAAVLTGGTGVAGGAPLEVAVTMGVANGVEALLGGVLVARLVVARGGLVDPAAYARLLGVAGTAAVAFTATAALGLRLTGAPAGPALTILAAHLAASVVLLPLLLATPGRTVGQPLGREAAAQLAALALVLVCWPGLVVPTGVGSIALLLLPLPLLVWTALRARPVVAATQVVVVCVVVTWATALDLGPVAALTTVAGPAGALVAAANVQAYVLCLAVATMLVSLSSHQRRLLVRHLEEERSLSTRILDTTAALIVVTDATGLVTQVNGAVERLSGFRAPDCLGRTLWEGPLIPEERREVVAEMFSAPDGSRVVPVREADLMHRRGERLRVVWRNNVVRDASGQVRHVVCTAVDVTEQRTNRLLIEHLFGAPMAAPMVSIDPDLQVTVVNRACEELIGVSRDEIVGQSATVLMTPEQRDELWAEGEPTPAEVVEALSRDWAWTRPDGVEITVAARTSVVRGAVDKPVGYLVVLRDVTDSRASEQAMNRALEAEREAGHRLRRLDAAKDEFVSTVSHELRTPTTSIVGYAEMLRDGTAGPVNDLQRDLLDVVGRNSERLIALADNLLTLARLETPDGSGWTFGDVDLRGALSQASEAVAPLLAGRDLELDILLPDGAVTITGDPEAIDRVLVNLLSNAVKFTPDGGRITGRVERRDDHAVLEVSDTGIGIPTEEQAELFTKFFRSSTAHELAIPGTGLGLSIIQRIVEDHAGDITVTSAAGEGATFTVTLPLVAVVPATGRLISAG